MEFNLPTELLYSVASYMPCNTLAKISNTSRLTKLVGEDVMSKNKNILLEEEENYTHYSWVTGQNSHVDLTYLLGDDCKVKRVLKPIKDGNIYVLHITRNSIEIIFALEIALDSEKVKLVAQTIIDGKLQDWLSGPNTLAAIVKNDCGSYSLTTWDLPSLGLVPIDGVSEYSIEKWYFGSPENIFLIVQEISAKDNLSFLLFVSIADRALQQQMFRTEFFSQRFRNNQDFCFDAGRTRCAMTWPYANDPLTPVDSHHFTNFTYDDYLSLHARWWSLYLCRKIFCLLDCTVYNKALNGDKRVDVLCHTEESNFASFAVDDFPISVGQMPDFGDIYMLTEKSLLIAPYFENKETSTMEIPTELLKFEEGKFKKLKILTETLILLEEEKEGKQPCQYIYHIKDEILIKTNNEDVGCFPIEHNEWVTQSTNGNIKLKYC